jgi:hypothetical protein
MKLINRSRAGYLATLAAGIAIGFTAVGTAFAGSHPAAAAKAVTHHFTIAASGFAPDSIGDVTKPYENQWDPATLTDQGSRCFNAYADLPSGATIHSVTFFFTNGATDNMQGELNRQNLSAHQFRILAHFHSTPTGTTPAYTVKTVKITSHNVVDTSKYAYSLGVCPFGDASFTGVMINYTG